MGWNVHKIFYVTFFYNEQVETTWSREWSTLIIYYKLWMYSRIFICTIKEVKLKSIRDNEKYPRGNMAGLIWFSGTENNYNFVNIKRFNDRM